MSKQYKPGERPTDSGQFIPVGPRGGKGDTEVTGIEGKPLPPTPRPNMTWQQVDKTKHKGR